MISQDLLATHMIITGLTLFIVAAIVMIVLTVMVRALASCDAPKLSYLDIILRDRLQIAHEIRRDSARFLTLQDIRAYTRMRQVV